MATVGKPSPGELEEVPGRTGNRATSCIKKTLSRTLKMLIFVGCFTGFAYQSMEFLTNFYTYPTVVNMDVERMDEFPIPALTFCSKYLYNFEKYCRMFEKYCEKPADIESFCLERPHKCRGNNTDAVTPKILPTRKGVKTWSKLNELTLSASQALYSTDQMDFVGPFHNYFHSNSGYEVCFRLGNGFGPSGLQKTPKINSKMLPWKKFWVKFMESKNIFFLPEADQYGTLYIHSPLLSYRSSMKSIILRPNKEYAINVNLEQMQLLPYPYESDCIDYEELWNKNNKTGPVSREMYEFECNSADGVYFEKIGDHYAYVQPDLCDVLAKNPTANEVEFNKCQCKKKCKNECLRLNYDFSAYESNELDTNDGNPNSRMNRVDIIIEKENVRVLTFTPQYMDVEVFSYVGGFIGCWLGISLWSSTDILWTGISAFGAMLKKKRKQLGKASKNSDDQP